MFAEEASVVFFFCSVRLVTGTRNINGNPMLLFSLHKCSILAQWFSCQAAIDAQLNIGTINQWFAVRILVKAAYRVSSEL